MSERFFPALLIALLGLFSGSFINICIHRIPSGKPLLTPLPQCPSCRTRLMPIDLIPIASYIILRGNCRYCGASISPRYPFIEFLTALLFLLVYFKIGAGTVLIKYILVTALLLLVTFIDLDYYIIPNSLVLAGLIAGAIFLPLTREHTLISALSGIIFTAGFLLLLNIVSRGGMGMGDVKYGAFIGIILGWPLSLLAVFLACLTAGLTGAILLITRCKRGKDPIPFGPFLSMGTFISFMWGENIKKLYIYLLSGL